MTSPPSGISQFSSEEVCSVLHSSTTRNNGNGPPQIAEPSQSLQSHYLSYDHLPKPKALKVMRCDKENVHLPNTMLLTLGTANHLDENVNNCFEENQLITSAYYHSECSAFHPLTGRWEPLRSCSANQLGSDMDLMSASMEAEYANAKHLLPQLGYCFRVDTLSSINERTSSSANTRFQRPLSATSESVFFLREPSPSYNELLVNRPRNPTPLTAAGFERGATITKKCTHPWRLRALQRSSRRSIYQLHSPYLRRLSCCSIHVEGTGLSPSVANLLASSHIHRRKCQLHSASQSKERDCDGNCKEFFLSAARQYLVGLPDVMVSPSSKIHASLLKSDSSACASPCLRLKGLRSQSCIPFPVDHDVHLSGDGVIISQEVSCISRPVRGSVDETWSYPELDVNQIECN